MSNLYTNVDAIAVSNTCCFDALNSCYSKYLHVPNLDYLHISWFNKSDKIMYKMPTLRATEVDRFMNLSSRCKIALQSDPIFLEKIEIANINIDVVISHIVAMGTPYIDAVFNNRDIIYYLVDNDECQECIVVKHAFK